MRRGLKEAQSKDEGATCLRLPVRDRTQTGANAQAGEQEPDMRCGTSGTSGHVTAKSSIRKRGVLYKSGVYASKVTCLTLGGLSCATGRRVRLKLAED